MTDQLTPSRPRTYDGWTDALAAHFFRPEYARSHVMFLVDDAALGEIFGGGQEEALQSLVKAISPRLRRRSPRQLFADIESASRLWRGRGAHGVPPCLPLLAVTVLAATRMGRTKNRAGHNYYGPFIELLDLDVAEQDVIVSYGDAMPSLWEILQWWLDECLGGSRGLSTIVADTHFTRIGYADSQTLFSSSDRDKLTRFLAWLGLRPGEHIDEQELLAYFRRWVGKGDQGLTLGAEVMLGEDETPRQLLEFLTRAAADWQGVVRDEHGRTEAPILITLRTFPPPSQLGLTAQKPPGFPVAIDVTRGDVDVHLAASGVQDAQAPGWYRVPLQVDSEVLANGISLAANGRVLSLAPSSIHVLHKHAELGCWASADRLRPGEEAWLLVQETIAEQVGGFLREHARRSGSRALWSWVTRRGASPSGWRLARGVCVDSAVSEQRDQLSRLRPRLQNRLALQGGLLLPRGSHVYLSGGEPDLWLPDGDSGSTSDISVDGVTQTPPGPMVRTIDMGLGEGTHEVRAGPLSRVFSTLRTVGRGAPAVDHPLGHAIQRAGPTNLARTLDAQPLPDCAEDVTVAGASMSGPPDGPAAPDRPTRPLVLPVSAKACVLIGAVPGQIAWAPAAPSKPMWMNIAGLEYRVYEYFPPFPVVWVLLERLMAPRLSVRLRLPTPPDSCPAIAGDPTRAWATTILEWEPPTDPAENELWDSYMDVAEQVLEA